MNLRLSTRVTQVQKWWEILSILFAVQLALSFWRLIRLEMKTGGTQNKANECILKTWIIIFFKTTILDLDYSGS